MIARNHDSKFQIQDIKSRSKQNPQTRLEISKITKKRLSPEIIE